MIKKFLPALSRIRSIFGQTGGGPLHSVVEILIQADVGVKYAEVIRAELEKAEGDRITVLREEIARLLSQPRPSRGVEAPVITMVSGVNGSGKTTTAAKLANLYRKAGTVLLVSGDTYRDAAHEQLNIWAQRADVEIVASQRGQDAGAVVHDAMSKAFAKKNSHVVIDTAGRLHTRADLMEELKKIVRVIIKFRPKGPDYNILTIDANLGQNSIQQAKIFTEAIAVNGLVLTKFDGTAKGGAIIPICNELRLPVLYLGVGEGIEDIVEFDPEDFARSVTT
ncbi:MAG: signal recognition particle-docking protein FtsY [candidate division WOR-3 bacterium]|nr:MAG: signal recognition particle-docking protein FtsY [candidate division WOR-3 bacterium]